MNILHLPYNISNWTPIHVNSLNKIEGINARGLVFGDKIIIHNHDQVIYIPQKNIFQKIISLFTFIKHVFWADVIHWYWDEKIFPNNWALRIIKRLKKPALVEWLGGEIRIPQIEFLDNNIYKSEYYNFSKKKPNEIKAESLSLQRKFKKFNFDVILCPEMEQYIDRDIFSTNYSLRQRIEVSKFEYTPVANNNNNKIRIVHSPSNKAGKGTDYVIQAIEELKIKYDTIDFQLIYNVPNKDAIQMVKECDIFIDQFIIGSYGMAAMEAMAMGKVVFCYIKESVINQYPVELPIINANILNLKSKIEYFINHREELTKIGYNSREYIKKHHDTEVLIPELLNIYKNKIENTKTSRI